MRSQPNPDPFLLTKAPNPLPFRGSDPFLVITPHQCYLFSSRPSLPLQGDSCLHRKPISDTIHLPKVSSCASDFGWENPGLHGGISYCNAEQTHPDRPTSARRYGNARPLPPPPPD